MNAQNVVVNIVINASSTQAGVTQYNAAMQQIVRQSRQAAQESALSFETIFGANFFADLFANIVRAAITGGQNLIREAVRVSTAFESAFAGLRGIGRNLGLNPRDVQQAVEGLDLVKSGLLTVNDAATSVKNLLATGFSLDQSIELVKRFADTAAFGRQASLSFGYAISSATEGIKNQNSILVDNAGVTKNLSVILAEQGFQIQDLSDKVRGAAARQALYNGLIKETKIQQGDANRLLETAQGRFVQLESAQTRALKGIGDFITQSKTLNVVLSVLIGLLDLAGKNAGAVIALAAAVGILTVAIIAMNTAQLAALPVISQLIASISLMGKVMVGTASLAAGATATLLLQVAAWGAVAIAIGALIYIIYSAATAQRELVALTNEQVKASVAYSAQMKQESDFLAGLKGGVAETAEEQQKLKVIYESLDAPARARVAMIQNEAEKTKRLSEERAKLAQASEFGLQAEGTRRVLELVKAQDNLTASTKTLTDAQQKYASAATEASLAGGIEGAAIKSVDQIQGEALETGSEAIKKQQEYTEAIRVATQDLLTFAIATKRSDETVQQSIERTLVFAQANGASAEAVARVRDEINRLINSQTQQAQTTRTLTDIINEQVRAYDALTDAQQRSQVRRTITADIINRIATEAANPQEARQKLQQLRKESAEADRIIKEDIRIRENTRALEEEFERRKPARTRTQTTELERLTKRVKELTAAVNSFADLTSREFELRFKAENLERQKRDLERILDLRRELNLQDQRAALPETAEGARLQVAALEQLVRVQDGVRKVVDETREADEQLAIAMRAQVIPVLNAGTRAELQYARAVRERASAEQQLTADLIVAERKRADTLKDEVGRVKESYQTLKLDLLRQLSDIESGLEQNQLLEAIQAGGEIDIEQKISGRVQIEQPKVPAELTQIANATKSITVGVEAIARVVVGSSPTGDAPFSTASEEDRLRAAIAEMKTMNAQVQDRLREAEAGAAISGVPIVSDLFSRRQALTGQSDIDVLRTTTTSGRFTVAELQEQVRIKTAEKERSDANRLATEEIKLNEARLHRQLIDFDKDLALRRSRSNIEREKQERDTALNIVLLNEQIAKFDAGDPEERRRAQQSVDEERARSRMGLREQLLRINDEIAHSGEDAALREEIAFKEAQLEIVKAHEDARDSIIRSQVQINEQLVFSSDIANAKVLEFIATQKGVTDIVADARIGVIQTTYDFIDRGLDRITRKLGVAGGLIKSITSDLLKLLVNRYFLRLFGLEGSTGAAASNSFASQFNPFALAANVLRPAGAISNLGGLNRFTLTGGFAGGASPAATGNFFSQGALNALNPFTQFLSSSSRSTSSLGFLPTVGQQNAASILAHEGLHAGVGAATSAGAKSSLTTTLAGALPLLGLSAGASLGGGFFRDSQLASGIGTVAGGALGLSAGLAGFLAAGGTLGSGSLAAAGTAIAGALPIIAPIAIAAIVASFFINRSALRRKEETLRTEILNKAKGDLDTLITQARKPGADTTALVAQAMAIRQQYLTDVGQLRDSKTRRIAQETVRELDYKINILKGEVAKADRAAEVDKLLIPTFGDGGIFRASDVSYRTTIGGFSRRDRHLALLADDETVITPQTRAALGGNAAFARAGVKGYSDGRAPQNFSNPNSMQDAFRRVVLLMVPTEEAADELMTKASPDVVVRKVRTHVKKTRRSGLAGDIMGVFQE